MISECDSFPPSTQARRQEMLRGKLVFLFGRSHKTLLLVCLCDSVILETCTVERSPFREKRKLLSKTPTSLLITLRWGVISTALIVPTSISWVHIMCQIFSATSMRRTHFYTFGLRQWRTVIRSQWIPGSRGTINFPRWKQVILTIFIHGVTKERQVWIFYTEEKVVFRLDTTRAWALSC